MAASERDRHELYRALAELIGEEHAGILMRHLPPSEWPQLVTKDDLDRALGQLRAELRGEVQSTEARLLTAMAKQSRTFVLTTVTAIVGSVATPAAIAFAAAGLV